MVAVGAWLKNKETGEVVRVIGVGAFIRYRNQEVDGEIRSDQLSAVFDDISDPTTTDEIEAFLRAVIEAGEAETGLYDTGIAHVVVDRVDGQFTFQWFHERNQLSEITAV